MISWQIDYYKGKLPLRSYCSETSTFKEVPTKNVVFLWVRQEVDGQEYEVKCVGWDNYFLKEVEGGIRFGGWMDDGGPYHDILWLEGKANVDHKLLDGPPNDITDVKFGVWVPKPDSITLGLE
jgi:hypothetical protein